MSAIFAGTEWPDALRVTVMVASTVVSRPSGDRYPRPSAVVV